MAKSLFIILVQMVFGVTLAAESIGGQVTLDAKLKAPVTESSVLFIYARKAGVRRGPPTAVLRIPSPKFPVKFSLSKKNVMIPGTQFKGPFDLTARLTTNGNAMQRAGAFQGLLAKEGGVKLGSEKNTIVIDSPR